MYKHRQQITCQPRWNTNFQGFTMIKHTNNDMKIQTETDKALKGMSFYS